MTGPLSGVKVLEASQIVAGPVSGVSLSDFGADVVKLEPPGGEATRILGAFVRLCQISDHVSAGRGALWSAR